MSDETDTLETRLSEAASRASLWKSFLEHPGWEEFAKVLQSQMNMRQEVVCSTPINSEYTSYAQEFFKGEFSGIKTALSIPQAQIEEAKREQQLIMVQLEKEHEIEDRVSAGSRSRVDTDDHFGE